MIQLFPLELNLIEFIINKDTNIAQMAKILDIDASVIED